MELISKSSNGYYTVKLTLTEGEINIEDNTSPVTYKLQIISGSNARFSQMKVGRSVKISGTDVVNVDKDELLNDMEDRLTRKLQLYKK